MTDLPLAEGLDWNEWLGHHVPTRLLAGPAADRAEFVTDELLPKLSLLAKKRRTQADIEAAPAESCAGQFVRWLIASHLQATHDGAQCRLLAKIGPVALAALGTPKTLAVALLYLLQQTAEAQRCHLGLASWSSLVQVLTDHDVQAAARVKVPAWFSELTYKPSQAPAELCVPKAAASHRQVLLTWSLLVAEALGAQPECRDAWHIAVRTIACLLYGLVACDRSPSYTQVQHSTDLGSALGHAADPEAPQSMAVQTVRRCLSMTQGSSSPSAANDKKNSPGSVVPASFKTKPGLIHTMLRRVWRWIRNQPTLWEDLMHGLVQPGHKEATGLVHLTAMPSPLSLPLLAGVVSTLSRIKPPTLAAAAQAVLSTHHLAIEAYLTTTAFVAKQALPPAVWAQTADLWAMVDASTVSTVFFPLWEKLVLRSAETTLASLVAVVPLLPIDPCAVWCGVLTAEDTTQCVEGTDRLGRALFGQFRSANSRVLGYAVQLALLTVRFASQAALFSRFAAHFATTLIQDKGLGTDQRALFWSVLGHAALSGPRASAVARAQQLGAFAPGHAPTALTCPLLLAARTEVSLHLVQQLEAYLPKETQETVILAALECYTSHVLAVLSDVTFLVDQWAAVQPWWSQSPSFWKACLIKATKPAVRRQWAHSLGQFWWQSYHEILQSKSTEHRDQVRAIWAPAWAEALTQLGWPTFQTASQKLFVAPLTYAAGPAEGFVALVLANMAAHAPTRVTEADDVAFANSPWPTVLAPFVQPHLLSTGQAKVPLLVSEKIYTKLASPTEAMWLLRAIQASWPALVQRAKLVETPVAQVDQLPSADSDHDDSAGTQFLSVQNVNDCLASVTRLLVYLALQHPQRLVRSLTNTTLTTLGQITEPVLVAKVMQPALEDWLRHQENAMLAEQITTALPAATAPRLASSKTAGASAEAAKSAWATQELEYEAVERERRQVPDRLYQLLRALFAQASEPLRSLALALGDYTSIVHHPLLAAPSHVAAYQQMLVNRYRQTVHGAPLTSDPWHGPLEASPYWVSDQVDHRVPWWANPDQQSGRYSSLWVFLLQKCGFEPARYSQTYQFPLACQLLNQLSANLPTPDHQRPDGALLPTASSGGAKRLAKQPTTTTGISGSNKKMTSTGSTAKGQPAVSADGPAQPSFVLGFYQASLQTVSTLTFISPSALTPLFWHNVHQRLFTLTTPTGRETLAPTDPLSLADITATDVAIWQGDAHSQEPVVDVLHRRAKASTKSGAAKSSTARLSKEEQAVVDEQLAKEAIIRTQVQQTYAILRPSLDLIDALLQASQLQLEASLAYESTQGTVDQENQPIHQLMASMLRLLLLKSHAVLPLASPLVGARGLDLVYNLGRCATPRWQTEAQWLTTAVIRAQALPGLWSDWCQEPLEDLILRLLFHLHFQATLRPFGLASFTFIFPLLQAIVQHEGFGPKNVSNQTATQDPEYEQSDPATEQLGLTVKLLAIHAPVHAAMPNAPRAEILATLLHLMNHQPKLLREVQTTMLEVAHKLEAADNVIATELRTLVAGIYSSDSMVRQTVLQALEDLNLASLGFAPEIWVARFDSELNNHELADMIWVENKFELPRESYYAQLAPILAHPIASIRTAAAHALAQAIVAMGDADLPRPMTQLYQWYEELAAPLTPQYDKMGIVIPESLDREDPWGARLAIGLCLEDLAPALSTPDLLRDLVHFLIQHQALGDRDAKVRGQMLRSGLIAIEHHATTHAGMLVELFDKYLNANQSVAATEDERRTHDYIRENVVVLYGGLACYLPAKDPRVTQAVDKLMAALATPSEPVQQAVAECLVSLVGSLQRSVPKWTKTLLQQALESESYAARRGAAYGVAGLVKGVGICALKEQGIMETIQTAVKDGQTTRHIEGAMFIIETLSAMLGQVFEPYAIQLVPLLLISFSDAQEAVRQATVDASRVMMGILTKHGVRLLLPSMLRGLHNDKWRTKVGSIDLLSGMAYCEPQQLSISLPQIVPSLVQVLADSHHKVQEAARRALDTFGEVITNPEIQSITPILLRGLEKPGQYTQAALTQLLKTAFVHYIDASSLALIVPILKRGLRERNTKTKRQAAQVIGSMASLTSQRDLAVYLPTVVPILKEILVDTIPETRATSAKALGLLVQCLGEDHFPGLVAEFYRTLESQTSSMQRSGAAQGLSEVISGLGVNRLEQLLPDIIANANHSASYVREGFVSLLIYLPVTFGDQFQPYLSDILPAIVRGLADTSDYVRDASLRAGQIVIRNFAARAVDMLLPQLEQGLFDDSWRIRNSCVELIGDLLFQVTGMEDVIKAKSLGNVLDGDEDDEEDAESEAATKSHATTRAAKHAEARGKSANPDDPEDDVGDASDEPLASLEDCRKRILETLGPIRTSRVLASLYVVRSDPVALVRKTALAIWKALVSNTPRTVKDNLATIMDVITTNLTHTHEECRLTATRCLGELVRKLGEAILHKVIPILDQQLASTNTVAVRQGACLGLSEVIATTHKSTLEEFAPTIIPALRAALRDGEPAIREAAATAFGTLQRCMGEEAVDQVLPHLLQDLRDPEVADQALDALREILMARAHTVFPVLIPKLIEQPITALHARALGSLVTVAGPTLNRHLDTVLAALLQSIKAETDPETLVSLREAMASLVSAIDDDDGLYYLMMLLFEYVKPTQSATARTECCNALATVCSAQPELAYGEYTEDWLNLLLPFLNEATHPDLVQASSQALTALLKTVDRKQLVTYAGPLANALSDVVSSLSTGAVVAGFALPKGIGSFVPVFSQGLLVGSPALREASALGMGHLVNHTPADHLKPYVTLMTGPLIRIVGDRHPPAVKASILQTLNGLLVRVPALLRPFLPQLQRTFIKSLSDPELVVRQQATRALTTLIALQTRLDPLVTELCAGFKSSEVTIRQSMLNALAGVLTKSQATLSDAAKQLIQSTVAVGLTDSHSDVQAAAAQCLGGLYRVASTSNLDQFVHNVLAGGDGDINEFTILMVSQAILTSALEVATQEPVRTDLVDRVVRGIRDPVTARAAIATAYRALQQPAFQTEPAVGTLLAGLVEAMESGTNADKAAALVSLKHLAKSCPTAVQPYLPQLVPSAMSLVRDRNLPVKLASERALLYLFNLPKGEALLSQFTASCDAELARTITDYHRRVLSKLAAATQQPDYDSDTKDQDVLRT
ncbi:translational activator of GCN4 [Dimargaris verticillata]|uniref:Translational activator of GCN4 n=1 Tax=Dimargaris verticillata TaxID=2761393 RepID=A0A9W8B4J3_9FUNG|nr:translational activator of GCN4 [Dimargaris verticillata]